MTDICSIWAYDEIKESGYVGKRQAQYLDVFVRENRPLTHLQATKLVSQEWLIRLPERNGRIAELENMGFIEKHDIVVCEVTHKKVNRWKYTGRKKPFQKKNEYIQCPKCKGHGVVEKIVYENKLTFEEIFGEE